MKRMDNVDIIPMAGLALLVVLIMMIFAPMAMTHTNTPVEVPSAHTAETKTEEHITITYTIDQRIYVNDEPIRPEDLETIITQQVAEDPYRLIVIRADKNVLHRDVLEILAKVRQSGAKRIACATKRPKGG